MKKIIKINFVDFWDSFDVHNNFFIKLLKRKYDIQICHDPDFIIYSAYGKEYKKFNCVRIFYTAENVRPNFLECDYAFSFDPANGYNYRLPYYFLAIDLYDLTKERPAFEEIVRTKTKFCNMVVSNRYASERLRFFRELSKYKKVDSGGRFLNNIGGPVKKKLEFINDYKFTIAFENSCYPGYTTEKIAEPMLCNSIPIYWGNPQISNDFNPKSFINCHDYPSFKKVIDEIVKIDNDADLYKEYLSQPFLMNNKIEDFLIIDNILSRFDEIFVKETRRIPVSQTWKRHLVPIQKGFGLVWLFNKMLKCLSERRIPSMLITLKERITTQILRIFLNRVQIHNKF